MPSARTLACPASLKGVLSAREAVGCARGGIARVVATSTSCRSPTAARERSTCCSRRSAASGARRTCTTPSAGRGRRAGSGAGGDAASRRRRSIPLDPHAPRSARGLVAWARRADPRGRRNRRAARLPRRHGERRRRGGPARGARRAAGADAGRVRRRRPAGSTPCALFAAQKGATPEQLPSSRLVSSRWRSTRTCRAPAPPVVSARRSRRSAPSSVPGAALVLDLARLRPGALRPRRHGRGHRRRDDRSRQGAGRGRCAAARGRRALRRLRRPRRRAAARRRDGRALGRSGAGA